jgi:hypothetical protein
VSLSSGRRRPQPQRVRDRHKVAATRRWSRSQGGPVLRAQAGLTKDRAQDWHGHVAGMHRDSDSTAVWMNVPGVAAALPAVHQPRLFKFSDDVPGSEGPKRHGEEA